MRLTEDIFHAVGEHLNSQAALASLCRVSKTLNRIFTPILYRRIRVQDCSAQVLACIAKLPLETHLRYCTELCVGKNVDDDDSAKIYAIGVPVPLENDFDDGFTELYDVESDVLKKCVQNMPALEILSVKLKELNYEIQELIPVPNGILLSLSSSGKLRELSLHTQFAWYDWPIPPFSNLRKLSLRGILSMSPIVDTLIASPKLQHLDLAGPVTSTPHESKLSALVKCYDSKRKTSNAPLLHLEILELGVGFLPQKPWNDEVTDLSKLTEIPALKSLSIWNYTVRDLNQSFEDSSEYVPALYRFVNLVHLKANMVTEEILELVKHIRAANPDALSEFEIEEAHWSKRGREDGCVFITFGRRHGEERREFPVAKMGTHWKSLSIGGIFETGNSALSVTIIQCQDLEYLECDLPGDDLERFRIEVLPQLKRLKSLMVRNGPFANGNKELNPEEGAQNNGQNEMVNTVDHKISLAETIFQTSWDAWEARGRQEEKLGYVGLGCEVYSFMLPSPRGQDQEGKWKAMKLSSEESMEFEGIKSILERGDGDRFRLGWSLLD